MIGAGRDTKEDAIDPAVGVILEVKIGQKVDAGARAVPRCITPAKSTWKRPRSWWKTPSAFPAQRSRGAGIDSGSGG